MAFEFPAFLKLEYRDDGSAKTSFMQAVDGTLGGAEKRFQQFSSEAQRMVDRVLSRPMTMNGSLDLGVAELQRQAAALQQNAVAAREVAVAVEEAAREAGDFSQAARLQIAAAQAVARETEQAATEAREYAAAQEQVQAMLSRTTSAIDQTALATRRGGIANDNAAASTNAMRFGMMDLGRQLSDVSTMWALGARPMQIFASQSGQIIQSVQMMTGGTSKLANFLMGPWGIAITTGALVLTPLIGKLFETKGAAEETATALQKAMDALFQSMAQTSKLSDALTAASKERATALGDLARLNREIGTTERSISALQGSAGADPRAVASLTAQLADLQAQKTAAEKHAASIDRDAREAIEAARTAGAIQARNSEALDAKKKPPRDRSAQEAKRLADFGDRAAESIARVNARFDEQPKLIDQAAQATRQLDAIIKDLSERKPAGFKEMIEDAERAKGVIQDALVRPFRDLATEAERRVQIDRLLTAGREDEAAVLQTIWQVEQELGPLSNQQASAVRQIVEAREDELAALRRLQDEQNAYLDATRAVRGEIEAIFAGRGSISGFKDIFRDLNAKVLTKQLFGDVLDKLDDSVKAQFGRAVDALERDTQRAGEAALTFADTLNEASRRIATGASRTGRQSFAEAFGPDFIASQTGAGGANAAANDNVIFVTADRPDHGVAGMSPDAYAHLMARAVVKPLVEELGDLLGPRLAEQIGGALEGALFGYTTAGTTGGILGGLQGLNQQFGEGLFGRDFASQLGSTLGTALQGAQMGSMVSGLANAFGIHMSGTGAQIGGALGSIFGPVGSIAGSLAGGLIEKIPILGGLLGMLGFGGAKYGTATLTGANGSTVRGSGDKRRGGATTLAGSVQEALANIAEQLDAELGSFRTSIGTYKESFRVSTTGRTGKLKVEYADVRDFGDDQGAAIAFAVLDAIRDGAIKGLRAGAQRLLSQGGDVERAVQEALDFQSVFTRLKALKDPVGADLDKLDGEFERLKSLFTKAGASTQEWTELEELYWLERDQIIKDAMDREFGTLKGFLTELTVGNSALSLRDRKSAALAQYTPLANRVAAGDTTAYDDFVEAARALLDIERQLSGSQSGYFNLLDQVTALTQGALDGGPGAGFANRNTPFGAPPADNAGVIASISELGDRIVEAIHSQGDATNRNIGTLIDQGGSPQRTYTYAAAGGGW